MNEAKEPSLQTNHILPLIVDIVETKQKTPRKHQEKNSSKDRITQNKSIKRQTNRKKGKEKGTKVKE